MASSKNSKQKGKSAPKGSSPKGKKGTPSKSAVPSSLRKGALPTSVGEVWAAGIGALGEARKQGGQAFDALVARGEQIVHAGSDSARRAAGDVEAVAAGIAGRVKGTADDAVDGVQAQVERAVEAALAALGVPQRDEVAALQGTVNRLQSRLVELGAASASAPSTTSATPATGMTEYEVVPHDEGWAIRKPGAARALSVVKTKKEALRGGRAEARAHAPSRLTVFNLDGSAGEVTEYGD